MMITMALEEAAELKVTADALAWEDNAVPVLQAEIEDAAGKW